MQCPMLHRRLPQSHAGLANALIEGILAFVPSCYAVFSAAKHAGLPDNLMAPSQYVTRGLGQRDNVFLPVLGPVLRQRDMRIAAVQFIPPQAADFGTALAR